MYTPGEQKNNIWSLYAHTVSSAGRRALNWDYISVSEKYIRRLRRRSSELLSSAVRRGASVDGSVG